MISWTAQCLPQNQDDVGVLHDWSINGLQQSMREKITRELLVSHFCGNLAWWLPEQTLKKIAHIVATPHVFMLCLHLTILQSLCVLWSYVWSVGRIPTLRAMQKCWTTSWVLFAVCCLMTLNDAVWTIITMADTKHNTNSVQCTDFVQFMGIAAWVLSTLNAKRC